MKAAFVSNRTCSNVSVFATQFLALFAVNLLLVMTVGVVARSLRRRHRGVASGVREAKVDLRPLC